MEYDFSGWATKANLKCSDGRIITKDAFKDNDHKKVPMVWNHSHGDPESVLGHAILENREEGVYAYCKFNDSEGGKTAKLLVQHGDVDQLSIFANQLKQQGPYVIHGNIRELSLVIAGANPGAFIDQVIKHGEECEDEAQIYTGENIVLYHADNEEDPKDKKETTDDENEDEDDSDETIGEVLDSLNEKQEKLFYAIIGRLVNSQNDDNEKESKGGTENMKHNVFDQEDQNKGTVLSHADQEAIIELAKNRSVGSLQQAINVYMEENMDNDTIKHGIDDIETLFPDFKDVRPGAPEKIERDQGWVGVVMNGVHKSPISRIRTRQADVRDVNVRAHGYQKGKIKKESPNIKLLNRTTDPQTVYRKDSLHRDDIVDITEFDVVEYQYGIMRQNLYEELATAIMISDGREEGDEQKIYQEHIRSIWMDDDLYTIHHDVDIEAAKKELQGTNTGANFGENYIYAEAIVTAALYSRENYKGSGNLAFFCTPHLLNVMLLARDLNGRRIYDSKADLAAALNVTAIHTAEQFEGKVRSTSDGKKKKLLGIFVNLADYQVGATKGGEITRFNQFDIDFNQEKYLIETRVSGALTRVYSAICLEEDVTDSF